MNFMNNYNNTNPIIIGIDHGYGNIKTAHCCFKTGVAAYDKEPTFKSNLLIYEGRYYLIGEEHKKFISDKMTDSDYYILTLAAVARELNIRKLTSARVHLAAGLPLTWVSEQKDSFKEYLLQNDSADFTFKGVDYHVEFAGADIFPQGFSAVADKLREFKGTNMLYIEPVFRGKGIARKLAQVAQDWCKENGLASLTVTCAPCDVGMYQAFGFDTHLGATFAIII